MVDRTKTSAPKFAGDHVGAFEVVVNDADQSYRFTLPGKLMINAGVVATERSYADYGYVDEVVSCQFLVLSSWMPEARFKHKG